MPPKSSRTRGRSGRVDVDLEAKGALVVTNPDQAEISDRPIQPKLQPFAGP